MERALQNSYEFIIADLKRDLKNAQNELLDARRTNQKNTEEGEVLGELVKGLETQLDEKGKLVQHLQDKLLEAAGENQRLTELLESFIAHQQETASASAGFLEPKLTMRASTRKPRDVPKLYFPKRVSMPVSKDEDGDDEGEEY